ncbi:MAG: NTP transferase domain-containing protein [Candidatus Omnitrophica bacterium]|nr:NTP transferase domain-containing protein [Candidatus Omnitrophota bacterium]
MQIIIPMSGTGRRFVNAGYTKIKPLIEVDGRPMIEHVIDLFSEQDTFLFICNQDHLEHTDLENILKKKEPNGKIIAIPPHKKGPVFAVMQADGLIDDEDEAIVNYCDFGKWWSYQSFLKKVRDKKADGAITAYRGFHPHMLGTTNYAFIKEKDQWFEAIQEKEPFTDNRMHEFASDGTYYFKTGAMVKKYFQRLLENGPALNGEYYVSLVYNYLRQDGLSVWVDEIEHMLQWGEPRDLQLYQQWSDYFSKYSDAPATSKQKKIHDINLIPMAGEGERFVKEGYLEPKPLILIGDEPMIVKTIRSLPGASEWRFVCRQDHLVNHHLGQRISPHADNASFIDVSARTEGQACSCALGLTQEDRNRSLFIGACDHGVIWNEGTYQSLIEDPAVDVLVWTFRNHPSSQQNPQMYGWCETDGNNTISRVSVKVPISKDPSSDHAVIGAFYFRKAAFFMDALKRLIDQNIRVNNEFYVDSCINECIKDGCHVEVFEADHYVCWGTPDDVRTYQYWRQYFEKSGRRNLPV